jgi:hypothetical protein
MDTSKVSRKKAESWHPYRVTGDLYFLLRYKKPFAYTEGKYGWYCNYYDLGDDIILSVGVAPHGTFVPLPLCDKYNTEAYNIVVDDEGDKGQRMNQLLSKFKKELRRLSK